MVAKSRWLPVLLVLGCGPEEAGGMGWGHAKKALFEALNARLKGPREEYRKLMADTAYLDQVLAEGASKARAEASSHLQAIRSAIGIR